jgi:isoleucyl-tRNA synthetase
MSSFKDTVFLPKTDFSMRAQLSEKEPQILEQWVMQNLSQKIKERSKSFPQFVLHWGPPFANGHIHAGHAVNYCLKDIISLFKRMQGYNVSLIPGWDCHGLPIEWEIEKQYRAKGKRKEEISLLEFRAECRKFADNWSKIQNKEFQRLGVMGEFDRPYSTMDFESEASILKQIYAFVNRNALYRGVRPILWSVVEKTALAEAEIEYQDHTSTTAFVKFKIIHPAFEDLKDVFAVIWTTTPWTLPGNRAIAYGPQMDYVILEIENVDEGSLAQKGEKLLVAKDLLEFTLKNAAIQNYRIIREFKGEALLGTKCAHPLRGVGYDFEVPLLPADFVTTEQGTGLVHIAPGHGEDDFYLGQKYGIEVPETVHDDGTYTNQVPLFEGAFVLKANPLVLEEIQKRGKLLAKGTLVHSYPHSWRSKQPLIFRTVPQWFISLEENNLRTKALKAIDEVRWIPEEGKNRIRAMVENRPNWCISRQRSWGVPIAIYVHKETRAILKDPEVNKRILKAFAEKGSDAWFENPYAYLEGLHDSNQFEAVHDIIDVWFESGSTQAFVFEQNPNLTGPADLYVEGSDQHRGWFQSSLLVALGAGRKTPYKAVLTHGFVVDDKGRKMSKSMGNGVDPQDIIKKYGADVLRLWIVSSNYHDDLRIGDEILKRTSDHYRRFRNTLRFLLGGLHGFSEKEIVPYVDMPLLEKAILHKLKILDILAHETADSYDFQRFYLELHHFCAVDLSAFYFDIRKDSLYCDEENDLKRRATRTLMHILFEHICLWLSPVLCFTAEEAFKTYGAEESIHTKIMTCMSKLNFNIEAHDKIENLRRIKAVVTGALELKRADKTIGSSLEGHPVIYVKPELMASLKDVDFEELCIVSNVTLSAEAPPSHAFKLEGIDDIAVVIEKAEGEKCVRCWKILEEVKYHSEHLCGRCASVVGI